MLKKSASPGKAEVKAKVEAKMKKVRSSLNLDLNLNLPHSLRPAKRLFGLYRYEDSACRPECVWADRRSVPGLVGGWA
jgi:hypothetical protein